MNEDHNNGAGVELIDIPAAPSLPSAESLRQKVMIALPWMKSANPVTAFCVASLVDKRRTALLLNHGDSFVAHSRNSIGDKFLASGLEWLLTIDDDMIVPNGHADWFNENTGFNLPARYAGLNTLDRLLSHGKTLVGGLYFGRNKHGPPMYEAGCNNPDEAKFARMAPHDTVRPTRWVATGCLLIHRKVFLDIEKAFPRLARKPNGKGGNWFSTSEHRLLERVDEIREYLSKGPMDGEKALKAFQLLESASAEARHNSGLGFGEDVQFSIRAKEAGHQPYVDLGLVCGHVGACVYGPGNTTKRLT